MIIISHQKLLLEYFSVKSHLFCININRNICKCIIYLSSYVPCIILILITAIDTITADNYLLYKFGDINEINASILFLI